MTKDKSYAYLPGKRIDGIKTVHSVWFRSTAREGACFRCKSAHNRIVRIANPDDPRRHPNCRCIIVPVSVLDLTEKERDALGVRTPEKQDSSVLNASDAAAMLALKLTLLKLLEKGDEEGAAAVAQAMEAIRQKPEYRGKYDWQDEKGGYATDRKYLSARKGITITVKVSRGAMKNGEERAGMLISDVLNMLFPEFGILWGLYKLNIISAGQWPELSDLALSARDALTNKLVTGNKKADWLFDTIMNILGIEESLTFEGTHDDESYYVEVYVNYLSSVDGYTYEFDPTLQRILYSSEASQDVDAGFSYRSGEVGTKNATAYPE